MNDNSASESQRGSDGASLSTRDKNDEHTATSGTRESEAAKSSGSNTRADFIRSLGRAETLAVFRSKAFVYLILAIAAALVGLATYRYTLDREADEFKQAVSNRPPRRDRPCSPLRGILLTNSS
jgi:hypothetical protein